MLGSILGYPNFRNYHVTLIREDWSVGPTLVGPQIVLQSLYFCMDPIGLTKRATARVEAPIVS